MRCCGSSQKVREQLAEQAAELQQSERQLQAELLERDHQLTRVHEEHRQLAEQMKARADTRHDMARLRAELDAQRSEFALEQQRLEVELCEEQEQAQVADTRLVTARREIEAAEEAQEVQKQFLDSIAEAEVAQCESETECMEAEIARFRDQLGPLTGEYEQAAEDLRETQERLRDEREDRRSCHRRADSLEVRLQEARAEYARAQTSNADFEQRLQVETRELRAELAQRAEELRERDQLLIERDRELAEVSTQLADLQTLFDEVNQQLYSECKRIEGLQETVNACAKQSKELEALHQMLEESHQMLTQVRDALEHERGERVRTARLLKQEQQRTLLLLDVLKHFKEKLQGLTPQMLLTRLGLADTQALTQGVDKLLSASMVSPMSGIDQSGHHVNQHIPPTSFAASPVSSRVQGSPGRINPSEVMGSFVAPEGSSFAAWGSAPHGGWLATDMTSPSSRPGNTGVRQRSPPPMEAKHRVAPLFRQRLEVS